ncbi:glycerophosphodiester phosphodiesterase [Alicyclobacillus cycloheptanicus]|uniref:Glycerophosphoryl diester phosphodiesterase n=1 Tax=Alicyclobacillus cycloheptanicus TaxID=1457 RepID=A0ABT9XKJ2_9BACL|nr:glycerophosphodiester phosphodiesterase [Alicyclobacillus cycloheptanicus]MDQ0190308.1 glycerophosphoryl diester phosphodiesterase [Alicyclobacillus cycloheptanicus]WDM00045.1 glycerophosphodiester phosphodiesterase [Alicyclobacillus cycloheptanicus]
MRTEIWAHRGFSAVYPENTVMSFQQAIALGVDGIELDVHLTKDGALVVIHDETVDRTTDGTGPVGRMTLAEVKRLHVLGPQGQQVPGARVPTLEEVLDVVASAPLRVSVNIELKSGVVLYPDLEIRTWQCVQQFGLQCRTVFSSFNHYSLLALKRQCNDANIGLLYMEGLVDPWLYARYLHAGALHPYHLAVNEHIVAGAHRDHLRVHVFTVNDPAEIRKLAAWGVDAVITDRPDAALQALS